MNVANRLSCKRKKSGQQAAKRLGIKQMVVFAGRIVDAVIGHEGVEVVGGWTDRLQANVTVSVKVFDYSRMA